MKTPPLAVFFVFLFLQEKEGGQLKGVVVKQMLFGPGLREGSVHGSVNFLCPRFFLLLNMNDVDSNVVTFYHLKSLRDL